MKIEEFLHKLESLGFVDSGVRAQGRPDWLRSYDPPENLRSAITSLNVGSGEGKQYVTVQGLDYAELGDHLAMLSANEELLTALAAGSEAFLHWFNTRPI